MPYITSWDLQIEEASSLSKSVAQCLQMSTYFGESYSGMKGRYKEDQSKLVEKIR